MMNPDYDYDNYYYDYHECACGVPIPDDVEQLLCSACDTQANADYVEPDYSELIALLREKLGAIEVLEIICFNCSRAPHEIYEYEVEANVEGMTAEAYVIAEEGTYNPGNGHFCCTECYINLGMPSGPNGWRAP